MTFSPISFGTRNWHIPLNAALQDLQDQIKSQVNNVVEYGAVGDGVTDDTGAVQAAIDAGGITHFPPGVYLCTTLQLATGSVLQGVGRSGYIPTPDDQASTIKLKNGTNAALINGADQISNVVIRNLNFDGNKANNSSGNLINLEVGSAQDTAWHIHDCFLNNAAADGISIGQGRQAVRIFRTWIMRSANNGITLNGTDAGINNTLIGLSGSNGMYVGAGVQHITDCDIWSSTGGGILVDGVSMVSIIGCGLDRHQHSGIVVQGASDVTVTNCLLHSNSQAANNTYPHISQTAGNLSVVGTIFGADGFVSNPDYAIKNTAGTLREWSNRLVGGSTVTGYISDVSLVANLVTGDMDLAATRQVNFGGSASTANLAALRAATSDLVVSTRVTGDSVSRLTVNAEGGLAWSSGAATSDTGLSRTAANKLSLATADLRIATAGRGLQVAEGSNAKSGAATLVAGAATVSTTAVTANSRIQLTSQADGGTPGWLRVSARTAGTSFTITSSSATDTSTVAWFIVEPA